MPELIAVVAFLEASVRLGIPLALAAMGETITERSGVINIGLEGSLIAGALGGALGALAIGGPGGGIVVGALAGALVAMIFAGFAVGLGTDQIITGTAITLGGLGFTGAIYQARFGTTGTALTLPTLSSVPIPLLSDIPIIGSALFNQAPTTYFTFRVPYRVGVGIKSCRRGAGCSCSRWCAGEAESFLGNGVWWCTCGYSRRSPCSCTRRHFCGEHERWTRVYRDCGSCTRSVESTPCSSRCTFLWGGISASISSPNARAGCPLSVIPSISLPPHFISVSRLGREVTGSSISCFTMAKGKLKGVTWANCALTVLGARLLRVSVVRLQRLSLLVFGLDTYAFR